MKARCSQLRCCWSRRRSPGGAGPRRGAEVLLPDQEVKAAPELDAGPQRVRRRRGQGRARRAARVGLRRGAAAAAPGEDRSALVAELKKRNLRGFDVTVRIENFKQELKDPKPGGRLKQLAVNTRLSVFGATIPEAKVAFRATVSRASRRRSRKRGMAADSAAARRMCSRRDQTGGRSGRFEAVAGKPSAERKAPKRRAQPRPAAATALSSVRLPRRRGFC